MGDACTLIERMWTVTNMLISIHVSISSAACLGVYLLVVNGDRPESMSFELPSEPSQNLLSSCIECIVSSVSVHVYHVNSRRSVTIKVLLQGFLFIVRYSLSYLVGLVM